MNSLAVLMMQVITRKAERGMSDSSINSAVVTRMLQVTRQSWMAPFAAVAPERALPVRRLGSRQWLGQERSRQVRMPWGLQRATSHVADMHGHG